MEKKIDDKVDVVNPDNATAVPGTSNKSGIENINQDADKNKEKSETTNSFLKGILAMPLVFGAIILLAFIAFFIAVFFKVDDLMLFVIFGSVLSIGVIIALVVFLIYFFNTVKKSIINDARDDQNNVEAVSDSSGKAGMEGSNPNGIMDKRKPNKFVDFFIGLSVLPWTMILLYIISILLFFIDRRILGIIAFAGYMALAAYLLNKRKYIFRGMISWIIVLFVYIFVYAYVYYFG